MTGKHARTGDSMSGIVTKIKHEVIEVIPPTIFFFIAIGLLILTKRLMLQQYGIQFADVGAAIGELSG